MKKVLLTLLFALTVFAFSACSGEDDPDPDPDPSNGRPRDAKVTMLTFPHMDGYGTIVDRDMPILFEYEMRDYVKYQVAFVSCTCRAPRVNYWSVMYIDISTTTGEVLFLSFDEDGTGDYTGGFWGDSDPIPTGNQKTYQDFVDQFFPWIIGKNSDDLDGIYIFYNEEDVTERNLDQYSHQINTKPIEEQHLIDAYAGASVSTHSILRVVKSLLEYHDEKYMN